MDSINRRLGKNVFGSILLLAIVSFALFSGTASCEEIILTRVEMDHSQADTLLKSQHFAEAKALFLAVTQNSSDSELAMKSLARAARCEIRLGNLTSADQLFDKLKTDYSTHPRLIESIFYCGNSYMNAKKYFEAKNAYQLALTKSTDSDWMLKSKAKIASCQIRMGDYSSAENTIREVLGSYPQNPNLHAAIAGFGYQYQCQKKNEKAIELFQFVIQSSSDVESAFNAQLGIMQCEINLRNYIAALAAFEKLHKNHSSAKAFVEKATRVCGDIMQFDGPENVLPYIDRALEVTSDVEIAAKLLQFKARCHIDLGQSEQAQAVREVIELYSDKEYYPGVQLSIAYGYRKKGERDKATSIYNKVLQSSADQNRKLDARVGLVAIAASQDNDPNATTAALELLCKDFAGHEKLGWAVFVIGEEYQIRAHTDDGISQLQKDALHKKAISVWKKNIEEINDPEYKCLAYYYTGLSYKVLKDYQKSLTCFHKVINEFPEYKYAAKALFMIGRVYQKKPNAKPVMTEPVAVTTSVADPNEVAGGVASLPVSETLESDSIATVPAVILAPDVVIINSTKAAFEQLVEKYPNSSGAAYARQWLIRNNSK